MSFREMVRSQLHDALENFNGWEDFFAWIDDLDTEGLRRTGFAPESCPSHMVNIVRQLTGEYGENMSRWGSLRLAMPEDLALSCSIWNNLSYPSPNLRSLALFGIYEIHALSEDHQLGFPGLHAVEHLDLRSTEELETLIIRQSSLKSLVLREVGSQFPSLSGYTHLQNLRLSGVQSPQELESAHRPSNQVTVCLPRLKHLSVRYVIEELSTVEFCVPKLERLEIIHLQDQASTAYAKIQTEHLIWIYETAHSAEREYIDWPSLVGTECWERGGGSRVFSSTMEWDLEGAMRPKLHDLLLHYPDTTKFTFPLRFKELVLGILREARANEIISSALQFITFHRRTGDEETVKSSEL